MNYIEAPPVPLEAEGAPSSPPPQNGDDGLASPKCYHHPDDYLANNNNNYYCNGQSPASASASASAMQTPNSKKRCRQNSGETTPVSADTLVTLASTRPRRTRTVPARYKPEPPKPTPRKRLNTPRKAKQDVWSEQYLLENPKSILAKTDLLPFFTDPRAIDALTAEDKEELFQLLPGQAVVTQADGTRDFEPDFLRYDMSLRNGLRCFAEDIACGRFDPEWLRQANEAKKQRARGDFDAYEARCFQRDWAMPPLPKSALPLRPSAAKEEEEEGEEREEQEERERGGEGEQEEHGHRRQRRRALAEEDDEGEEEEEEEADGDKEEHHQTSSYFSEEASHQQPALERRPQPGEAAGIDGMELG